MLTGLAGVRVSSLMNAVENTVFRGRVRAVAVTNVNIATLNNGDSEDGLTLATGDLILLARQTDASENGVYLIDASEGSTARWSGFNVIEEVTIGSVFLVGEGTVYTDSFWMMVTGGDITLETTDLFFHRLDEARAEAGVPTEVADGARVLPWEDTFGRRVAKGFDLSQDAQQVVDVAPALLLAPITVFTQLTAPGSTASVNVENAHNLTFQIVVAAIDTSVDWRLEGSMDDANWFNLNDDEVDSQKTANGTYMEHKSNFKCKFVRFTFVGEVGGTAVTLDVDLMAGN